MQLSLKDRLMLVNQYEILGRLDPEEKAYYEEIRRILVEGYEIFYPTLVEFYTDMPVTESHSVLETLSLFRAIEHYKHEHPEDLEVAGHRYGHFLGYDGNEEAGCVGFTRFLLDCQGKFVEQLAYSQGTDHFNSHWPAARKYEKMVAKWKELGEEYELSKAAVLAILEAG